MGMWPSAQLSYGINVGEWKWSYPDEGDEPELPWLTWELWKQSWELETASFTYLESMGVKGVQLVSYGHYDHPRYALATRSIGCSGWGALTVVTAERLAITDDAARLLTAWKLLFPDRPVEEPAWRLSASFD